MTLPKTLTDAIEQFGNEVGELCADKHRGTSPMHKALAALEAAIAAAIQPVEPPTDAEVEAWERRTRALLASSGLRVQATIVNESGQPTGEDLDSPPLAYVLMLREAVALMRRANPPTDAEVEAWAKEAKAMRCENPDHYGRDIRQLGYFVTLDEVDQAVSLMRRARATEAAIDEATWNGGPTVTALMRGVEDAAIEWGKCVGDYNAACLSAPPPSGRQATDAVREAGHKCELAYGYFQKAIKALADHGAPTGSLERLRDRVIQHAKQFDGTRWKVQSVCWEASIDGEGRCTVYVTEDKER